MRSIARNGIYASAIFLLSCATQIQILSAKRSPISDLDRANIETMEVGKSSRNWEKIELTVSSVELRHAMRSDSTVFINIIDCTQESLKFPSIAFLENIALDEQQDRAAEALKHNDKLVVIHGYAPTSYTDNFKSTCVELHGGSYMGSSVRSNIIKVRV